MAAEVRLDLATLPDELAALAVGKVDLGAGANGKCIIVDGSDTTLVEINLQDPSFAQDPPGEGSYTVIGLPLQGTAVATGTAVRAKFVNKDSGAVFSGPCTTTGNGGFAELDNINIESGDIVTLTGGTYTQPSGA